jgi:DNA-binding HxlR family transcriptional regulator
MKRRNFASRPGCAVEATLDLIDGKWKGVILYHLQQGTQRFGELRRKMPGITQRMLTKQLRALEEDRLIIRKVYAEVPPRVEYCLSEIGESLRPVIDILKAWGESHHCPAHPHRRLRPSRRRSAPRDLSPAGRGQRRAPRAQNATCVRIAIASNFEPTSAPEVGLACLETLPCR